MTEPYRASEPSQSPDARSTWIDRSTAYLAVHGGTLILFGYLIATSIVWLCCNVVYKTQGALVLLVPLSVIPGIVGISSLIVYGEESDFGNKVRALNVVFLLHFFMLSSLSAIVETVKAIL